jgi:hypothetical protein
MIYLKAIGVGVVWAIISGAAWAGACLQIPIWWQGWRDRDEAVVAAWSYVGSGSIFIVALIGFFIGFAKTIRRHRPTSG